MIFFTAEDGYYGEVTQIAIKKIGFNGRPLASTHTRGFLRYTKNLVLSLHELYPQVEIHFFSDKPIASSFKTQHPDFFYHDRFFRPHLLWEQVQLPRLLYLNQIDIYHSTSNVGLPLVHPRTRIGLVVTVHDAITHLSMNHFPPLLDLKGWSAYINWQSAWRATQTSADRFITVSEYSRAQIESLFPSLSTPTHVIPNGVESVFHANPDEADAAILRNYSVKGNYFFYVGGFEARKNISYLIEEFLKFQKTSLFKQNPISLVLAGDAHAFSIAKNPHIVPLGFVEDLHLPALYRNAWAFVYPSLDEGFGLQVLEAMACGCPVLSSNQASLPEVGNSAAHYFDPTLSGDLSNLFERLHDPAAWRDEYKLKGLERAEAFTWTKTALQTFKVYEDILQN